jgi:hypothetical protein
MPDDSRRSPLEPLTSDPSGHDACPVPRILAHAFALSALLLCACAEDKPTPVREPPVEPLVANAYKEDTDGLRAFFGDLMSALEKGHVEQARAMAKSLELDQPKEWFQEVFGESLGRTLYQEYRSVIGSFGEFALMAEELREKGQVLFLVERFESADDTAAVGFQAMALGRMDKPTPLYSVRVVDEAGEHVFHLWSFVYQDGFFRWVGKLQKAASESPEEQPPEGKLDVREYRVRDAEAAGKAEP